MHIAVIGAGISGLGCAHQLVKRGHRVDIFEARDRIGGHTATYDVQIGTRRFAVDTGFIVYNEENYPNFTALLAHLGVRTLDADMALSVSLDDGAFEYSSGSLFAQRRNFFSARFWRMLRDVTRFYRHGPRDIAALEAPLTSLDDYLKQKGYCQAFRDDHLLPQAAAIWSTPLSAIRDYPAAALIRFFQNHGMMRVFGRGLWRTVAGGSRAYVEKLSAAFQGEARTGVRVAGVRRTPAGAELRLASGEVERFDQVVIATHGDQALALLDDATPEERRILSAFRYSRNLAVLHSDRRLMPKRRAAWTSWNHIGKRSAPEEGCVTYWMNRLQSLPARPELFVTLNPTREVAPEAVIRTDVYDHPLFDAGAIAAQDELWSLQGVRDTWFCGSYFGHGFHEAGLLGGVRRPWTVEGESSRIRLPKGAAAPETVAA